MDANISLNKKEIRALNDLLRFVIEEVYCLTLCVLLNN